MLERFRRMWIGWNVIVRGIVGAQSAVLMFATWTFGLAPVAMVLRARGTRLIDRAAADPNATTHRVVREPAPLSMDRASRMF